LSEVETVNNLLYVGDWACIAWAGFAWGWIACNWVVCGYRLSFVWFICMEIIKQQSSYIVNKYS